MSYPHGGSQRQPATPPDCASPLALSCCSPGRRRLGAFFGFGTIIATAFIHMLPPANEQLSSPCLPASWNDAYGAWAFLFTLLAVLAMQLLDYLIEGYFIKFSEAEASAASALPTGTVVSIHSSQAILSAAPSSSLSARKDKDSGDEESQGEEGLRRAVLSVEGQLGLCCRAVLGRGRAGCG